MRRRRSVAQLNHGGDCYMAAAADAVTARLPQCVTYTRCIPLFVNDAAGGADFPRNFLWWLGLKFRLMSVGVDCGGYRKGDTKLF